MQPLQAMGRLAIGSFIAIALTVPAQAQLRTELRDPVRGVSFYSVEISDDQVTDLNVLEGDFQESDRIALGLSAMVLDGAGAPDEFVFWVRHQGRRWLDYDPAAGSPVELFVDGEIMSLVPVRAPLPFVGEAGRLFEKIELEISDAQVDRLLGADEATVRLRARNGVVDKALTNDELGYLHRFRVSM